MPSICSPSTQDEVLLPIDIQTNKLLDIHYFHCQRIVEILKDTEASTKNLFGRYSSQRMKDWQEIIRLYEKDNVYLAEAAQMIIRTVNYEEAVKKEADYAKHAQDLRDRYQQECKQLGIKGECIKKELLSLLDELPGLFEGAVKELHKAQPAIDLYRLFLGFTVPSSKADGSSKAVPLMQFLITHGNVTTYQWRHGEPPEVVEETLPVLPVDIDNGNSDDQIDFGDLDLGTGASDSAATSPNGDFVHGEEAIEVAGGDAISWDISVEADGTAGDGTAEKILGVSGFLFTAEFMPFH
ncbi:hypothetical protein HPB52_018682 [Rhipicephalus sanguineus]|uniref:Uncharacterized protein n=1 Tax=Rhipicephalus sanguineus TaxID=34632 RepID=A0A9D4PS33_RHISA|nr:hypothetical protein HPB52_018682 [Rhipicephalus sanguineus]